MATDIPVTLKRNNGTDADTLLPRTSWERIDNIPSTFTPTSHTHQGKDISDANPSYFINNAVRVADGNWTATVSGIDSLYAGLYVVFKLPSAGASTCYLNINGLGAKIIYRYNTSKLTTHFTTNHVIPLVYDSVLNGGCWVVASDTYYSSEDYNMRWENTLTLGEATNGYHLMMQGIDGKLYPVTSGGDAPATNNTITSAELRIGGKMLYYGTSDNQVAGANAGSSYWYEGEYSGEMEYWSNKSSGWAVAYRPFYIVGSLNANGNLVLDGAGTTGNSFLTQTLPTTDDGKLYIQVGFMNNTYDAWRLQIDHPIYQYKDGKLRLYVPEHQHNITDINGFIEGTSFSGSYSPVFYVGEDNRLFTHTGITFTGSTNTLAIGGQSVVLANNSALTDARTALAAQSPNTATELSSSVDLNTLFTAGFYYQTANADTTGNNYPTLAAGSLIVQKSAGQVTQMYIVYSTGDLYTRAYYSSWSTWRKMWHSGDFSSTDKSHWDTAYGWGNHANAGYLTSQISHADVVVDGDVSESATANTIVKRNASGYIYGVHINASRGNETTTAASYIYDSGDGWMRKKTLANTQAEIVTDTVVTAKLLTGYTVYGGASNLAATDSVLDAFRKLEYRVAANDSKVTNSTTLGTTSVAGHTKIINNLTTAAYAAGEALGAYQGKLLKDAIPTTLGNLSNVLSETYSDGDVLKYNLTNARFERRTLSSLKSDMSLGNVTNESKATMFTSPYFTGTAQFENTPNVDGDDVWHAGNLNPSNYSNKKQIDVLGSAQTTIQTYWTTMIPNLLSVWFESGKTYKVSAYIKVGSSSTTNGVYVGFVLSAGGAGDTIGIAHNTYSYTLNTYNGSQTYPLFNITTTAGETGSYTAGTGFASTSNDNVVIADFIFTATADCYLQVCYHSELYNNTSYIRGGSMLMAEEI